MAIRFFSEAQQQQIVEAIRQAEQRTSGEIKVRLELTCPGDAVKRAEEIFGLLHLHETKLRNGVLFYLAVNDHKFAILGDAGIDAVVPPGFWNDIKEQMQTRFREGLFTEGLCEGIQSAGQQLKTHFPYQSGDTNELPDDISFG